jgi:hypothetical protein
MKLDRLLAFLYSASWAPAQRKWRDNMKTRYYIEFCEPGRWFIIDRTIDRCVGICSTRLRARNRAKYLNQA